MRAVALVVFVVRLPPVTNDVETANDLSDCEESNDFSGGDTGQSHLLCAGVADTSHHALRGSHSVLDG